MVHDDSTTGYATHGEVFKDPKMLLHDMQNISEYTATSQHGKTE
jgi:hypothetical protein